MPDDLLEKRSGHTQSVSRALSLLIKLSEEPEGLNLSELARRVKLAPSTAHRLLTTLQLDQFVRFEDGRWLIGVQSFNVGSSYMRARDICYMARPYLRFLMQETGETSNLALVENDELVYLAQTECPELMRALARPGAKSTTDLFGCRQGLSGLYASSKGRTDDCKSRYIPTHSKEPHNINELMERS